MRGCKAKDESYETTSHVSAVSVIEIETNNIVTKWVEVTVQGLQGQGLQVKVRVQIQDCDKHVCEEEESKHEPDQQDQQD